MLNMSSEELPCVRLELWNVLYVEHDEPLEPENSKGSNEHGKRVVFSSVYDLWVPAHSKLPTNPAAFTSYFRSFFGVEFKVLSANLKAVHGPWILLQKSKVGRTLELSAVGSWFLNSLQQKCKPLFVHIQEPTASSSSLLEWRSLCLKLMAASSIITVGFIWAACFPLWALGNDSAGREGEDGVVPCQFLPCLNVPGFWNTAVFRFPAWSGVGVLINNPWSYNSSASRLY